MAVFVRPVRNKYLSYLSVSPILGMVESDEQLKAVFEDLGISEFLFKEDGRLYKKGIRSHNPTFTTLSLSFRFFIERIER